MRPTQFPICVIWLRHGLKRLCHLPYGVAIALLGGSLVSSAAFAVTAQPISSIRVALVNSALVGSDRPLLQFGTEGPDVQAIQALLQIMGYYSGPIDGRYQENTVLAVSAFQRAAGLNEDGIVGPTTWAKLLPLPQQISATNTVAPSVNPPRPDDIAPSPAQSNNEPSPVPATPAATPAPNSDGGDKPTPPSPSTSVPEEVVLPTLRTGMRGPAVARVQERLRTLGFFQGVVDGVFGSQTETAVKAAQRSFNLNPDGIVGPATWTALLQ